MSSFFDKNTGRCHGYARTEMRLRMAEFKSGQRRKLTDGYPVGDSRSGQGVGGR